MTAALGAGDPMPEASVGDRAQPQGEHDDRCLHQWDFGPAGPWECDRLPHTNGQHVATAFGRVVSTEPGSPA